MLRQRRNINREVRFADIASGEFRTFDSASIEPTPDQILIFNETLEQLVAPLSEVQRQVVGLKLAGHSNSQIAKQVGRTERTVYRTLKTFHDQMKSIISSMCIQ